MQPTLDYIEQNLKSDITAEELAAKAGYSVWHFCRLFAQATGRTVAAYICKRRIDRALDEISDGSKAVDVVLQYGFDTYAGFYKAFVRMYGCSPKKYLSLYGKESIYVTKLEDYMITERELRKILTNWDIPNDLPFHDIYIMDGAKVAGNVWRVGNNFILKSGERDKMLKDLRTQKALAAHGFTTAAPVLTKTSEEYVDGERIYTLVNKVPGSPLAKTDRFGEKRYEFGLKYGKALAKLHRALAEVEADIMPNEENLCAVAVEWALPNVRKQNEQYKMGLTEGFFADYIQTFGKLADSLPKQLIHRDANPSNILFHNGDVSGFIDFDLSNRNTRLWDVCYCATGILSEWQGVEDIHEKWPLILIGIVHGYNNENPLTPEEKQAIYYVLCSIQMVCVAHFASIDKDEFRELSKTNREMLCYIADTKEQITKIFE